MPARISASRTRDQQGPRLLGRIVRWLHRGTAVVPWDDVREQVLPVSD